MKQKLLHRVQKDVESCTSERHRRSVHIGEAQHSRDGTACQRDQTSRLHAEAISSIPSTARTMLLLARNPRIVTGFCSLSRISDLITLQTEGRASPTMSAERERQPVQEHVGALELLRRRLGVHVDFAAVERRLLRQQLAHRKLRGRIKKSADCDACSERPVCANLDSQQHSVVALEERIRLCSKVGLTHKVFSTVNPKVATCYHARQDCQHDDRHQEHSCEHTQ